MSGTVLRIIIADQKAWNMADIVMEERSVMLTSDWRSFLYLPRLDN